MKLSQTDHDKVGHWQRMWTDGPTDLIKEAVEIAKSFGMVNQLSHKSLCSIKRQSQVSWNHGMVPMVSHWLLPFWYKWGYKSQREDKFHHIGAFIVGSQHIHRKSEMSRILNRLNWIWMTASKNRLQFVSKNNRYCLCAQIDWRCDCHYNRWGFSLTLTYVYNRDVSDWLVHSLTLPRQRLNHQLTATPRSVIEYCIISITVADVHTWPNNDSLHRGA